MQDNKILQAILDKVVSIEQEFKKVYARFDKLDERIDKIGRQLANLEDDAPTTFPIFTLATSKSREN